MKLEQFLAMEVTDQDGPVDLRGLEYVSNYDDHLMCPICHCPFIRPLRLGCDHVFCQTCLNTAIRSFAAGRDDFTFGGHGRSFTCPTCRTPTGDVYHNVPRLLINMCDDLRVRCPFSSEGCDEIVPRGHVQSHADKYCGYKLMDCPSPDCDQRTRKKDLSPENKCMHELQNCLRCDADIMEQDYEVFPHPCCCCCCCCATANLSSPCRNTSRSCARVSKQPALIAKSLSSIKPSANTSTLAPKQCTLVPRPNTAAP
ncbi:putative TRAF-like signal transducer [Aspergillus undulatus]|uniref:putative TRAF-like signal transducer n=1 Tax=Aspergillus undulatus TaxID=1810928 RepID=UPI003CCDEDC2